MDSDHAPHLVVLVCDQLLCIVISRQHKKTRGRLDLAVLFTPSTPNRQNRNQVRWNICAGVRRSTPSFVVVQTEQSRDLFQKEMVDHCLRVRKYFVSLVLFWSTLKCPVLLVYVAVLAYAEYSKIAKSSPP